MKKISCLLVLYIMCISPVLSQEQAKQNLPTIKFNSYFDAQRIANAINANRNSNNADNKKALLAIVPEIHEVYYYLLGLNRGMGLAELEAKISSEANIFKIEQAKRTWDTVTSWVQIVSGPLSIIIQLIPENSSIGFDDSTRSILSVATIGVGLISKGIGNLVTNEELKKIDTDLSGAIARISVARQALDDINIRLKLYTDIKQRIGKQIDILKMFDDNCYYWIYNNTTQQVKDQLENNAVKYLQDKTNIDKYSKTANELEVLGTMLCNLYDELYTRVKVYKEIFDSYDLKNEDNPFEILISRINEERSSFISNGEIGMFTVLRDLKI